ncbi:hypothetical protein F6X40_10205 [Paraburkholderia sp. UCT31]|uniref:hypothetical protein n=1 Tax=Paraburkholderia sp. UCT31 TaxID=2615209 RepID=UPI0016552601|nr:hypothetical protein [Paraburkholderia sp. UCT31]MBC8737180.1 hypothetical protein [Paraburkholderia sp. UCT31]
MKQNAQQCSRNSNVVKNFGKGSQPIAKTLHLSVEQCDCLAAQAQRGGASAIEVLEVITDLEKQGYRLGKFWSDLRGIAFHRLGIVVDPALLESEHEAALRLDEQLTAARLRHDLF